LKWFRFLKKNQFNYFFNKNKTKQKIIIPDNTMKYNEIISKLVGLKWFNFF
jgi:hypothetical protein